MNKTICFCGNERPYQECCGRFISGSEYPETPEQLMRSRYSAYVQVNIDYIADTMKGPAAEGFDKETSKAWAESVRWIRLKVISAEFDDHPDKGFVEFVAVFREGGGAAQKIQERSEFHRIDGRWYYWDGVTV